MLSSYLNKVEYISCIKIGGISILPPLMTEERRKELSEDKERAIAIEKKLKAKRQSIDSGVMTGSYIDIFKNGELPVVETFPAREQSLPDKTACSSSETYTECISGDSFLKTALEDQEFQDFFYSTAERIFKDSVGCLEAVKDNDSDENLAFQNNKVKSTIDVYNISNIQDPSNTLDFTVCNKLSLVSSINKLHSEELENNVSNKEIPCVNEISPTPQIVRRNSYTLESPSPILLEHMAKESKKTQEDQIKWQPFLEQKSTHTGFKTFSSASKPRKTWNKKPTQEFNLTRLNSCPHSSKYNDENLEKVKPVPLRRTNTFSKPRPKSEVICNNFSLPTSSRTSPIHMLSSAQSTSCLQSILQPSASQSSPVLRDNVKNEQRVNENLIQSVKNNFPLPPVVSETSLTNQTSGSSHSQCDTDLLSASQHYLTDSFSQISTTTTQSVTPKPKWISHIDHSPSEYSKDDATIDADDSVSVCSSMSLSKFFPLESNASRPSTAEDIDSLFTELQLQHERQMEELLEQQHKEKIWLAAIKSNDRSILSGSNTATSAPYEENLQQPTFLKIKKIPCNKELFPNTILKSSDKIKAFSAEQERAAAMKITAFAKGYLTRRLLKTERVQQCIEMIQESLRNAFSLQTEQRLKKSELEFHERLAHQLTGSLNELQSIVSAPVAERMAIIAADRERLKKPLSRPVSALSMATRKSILRRQMSLNIVENKPQEIRTRTSSLCSTKNESAAKSNGLSKSCNVPNRRSAYGGSHQKNSPQH